jgi:hypothetical protein
MKADFSRITFDPAERFSQVLFQQGRVTVDADANEQSSILLHYLRTLAKDLLGPFSAPKEDGLKVVVDSAAGLKTQALTVEAGRIYVDGILVEVEDPGTVGKNAVTWSYASQPFLPPPGNDDILSQEMSKKSGDPFLLYLDVWERLVTWVQDDSIREKALGGPDTAVRAQVIWQLKARKLEATQMSEADKKKLTALRRNRTGLVAKLKKTTDPDEKKAIEGQIDNVDIQIHALEDKGKADCHEALDGLVRLGSGRMAARVDPGPVDDSPCVVPPDFKYRGAENQLYRVEIHDGGKAWDGKSGKGADVATFKWSRDNGSVVTSWLGTKGDDLNVASSRGFAAGNWVELSHDDLDLSGEPGILVRLAKVEADALTVDSTTVPTGESLALNDSWGHAKIRRWDQVQAGDVVLQDGAVPLTESDDDKGWIDLEDGVQVRFVTGGEYRAGDYWVFPARVATGDIEWPEDAADKAKAIRPHGVEHHFASLGIVAVKDDKWELEACNCSFASLTECDG